MISSSGGMIASPRAGNDVDLDDWGMIGLDEEWARSSRSFWECCEVSWVVRGLSVSKSRLSVVEGAECPVSPGNKENEMNWGIMTAVSFQVNIQLHFVTPWGRIRWMNQHFAKIWWVCIFGWAAQWYKYATAPCRDQQMKQHHCFLLSKSKWKKKLYLRDFPSWYNVW